MKRARSRKQERLGAAWLLAALFLLAPAAVAVKAKPDSASRAATPAPAPDPAAALALQLEMAASDSFYLEVDPGHAVMRLKLAGVALHEYPLLAIEQGVPRVAFVRLADASFLPGTAWPAVRMDPPRPEIRLEVIPPDPNAPDSTLPVFQPPPSIDEMPVPSSYRLRFGDELTLTVTSPRGTAATGLRGVSAAVRDKVAECREALSTRRSHLRLVLERADAQHLYRSLPPDTRLILLP
ncbi:MAG TPA: hypothetical protein VFE28_14445 [Candidatus Krumholzibacteria bacterium]|nr:hypothetical protein [Candidatus Krumholzibacteria bacterium]